MKKRIVKWENDRGETHSIEAEDKAELTGYYKGLLKEALEGRVESFEEVRK